MTTQCPVHEVPLTSTLSGWNTETIIYGHSALDNPVLSTHPQNKWQLSLTEASVIKVHSQAPLDLTSASGRPRLLLKSVPLLSVLSRELWGMRIKSVSSSVS